MLLTYSAISFRSEPDETPIIEEVIPRQLKSGSPPLVEVSELRCFTTFSDDADDQPKQGQCFALVAILL